nr:MAG TPA: hypothetical protein [Caudoviricetes sp.]
MAFSEEQEAQILDMMGKMGEFLTKQSESKEEKKEPEKKDERLLDEAKKNMEEKSNQEESQANIEKALDFNMKISTFAEKYKDILPASIKSVIDTANGKSYTSAIAKADEMRKAILEAYLEVQSNVDSLPDGMKAKANAYKALTEDAKRAKSGQYWEIVEVGAELQTSKKRAEAVNRANGNGSGSGEDNAFRAKFLSLGDKWKRKE